jgi:tetraacyldisaccharide 4'-kinase
MTASDGPLGRVAREVWSARGVWASVARGALLLPAACYRGGTALRNAAYDLGVLPTRRLPAPSVGVGNLTVGGTGKTPLCRFVAAELGRRGCRVGILLRGYGADEAEEYRESVPRAVVVADPDRARAAGEAIRRGADVLVLDDCFQRRDVRADVLLALVAAEGFARRRWPLPAGPWREGLGALRRADAVVVTRKVAPVAEAQALAGTLAARARGGEGLVADLVPAHLLPLAGGPPVGVEALRGRTVVALCGIGAPEAFAAQLAASGAAEVRLMAFGDHHAYSAADVAAARSAAGSEGTVVTTGKDAVKLRRLWPPGAPECRVAILEVRVADPGGFLARTLDVIAGARHDIQTAAAPPTRAG